MSYCNCHCECTCARSSSSSGIGAGGVLLGLLILGAILSSGSGGSTYSPPPKRNPPPLPPGPKPLPPPAVHPARSSATRTVIDTHGTTVAPPRPKPAPVCRDTSFRVLPDSRAEVQSESGLFPVFMGAGLFLAVGMMLWSLGII